MLYDVMRDILQAYNSGEYDRAVYLANSVQVDHISWLRYLLHKGRLHKESADNDNILLNIVCRDRLYLTRGIGLIPNYFGGRVRGNVEPLRMWAKDSVVLSPMLIEDGIMDVGVYVQKTYVGTIYIATYGVKQCYLSTVNAVWM